MINKTLKILAVVVVVVKLAIAAYFSYQSFNNTLVEPYPIAEQTYKFKHFEPEKALITNQSLDELKRDMLAIIGSESAKYTFVITDLHTGATVEHNSQKVMPPASIYKVPLAIIVLKDVDLGVTSLDKEYSILQKHKPYTFDELAKKPNGYKASLSELLSFLIQKSDNAAMIALEDYFGGVSDVQSRIKTELGVDIFTRNPHETTAQDVAIVFEGLYKEKYLSQASNELLLQMLSDVKPEHQNRIEAGLPDGVRAAHKIGDLIGTAQDAGIVYGPKRDFLIVILNKDINSGAVHSKMQQLTKVSYDYFNPVDPVLDEE